MNMIRRATLEDSQQIYQLFLENTLDLSQIDQFDYQETMQREGFVIGDETKADFEKLIQDKKYALVYEENEIQGFLLADHDTDYLDDDTKYWLDLEAKNIYYNNPQTCTVGLIVVGKNFQGKGIGSQLLEHLETKLRKDGIKHLFNMVRILPLTNCASILFHTKNKFRKIAIASPTTRHGLKNSASLLFYKQI